MSDGLLVACAVLAGAAIVSLTIGLSVRAYIASRRKDNRLAQVVPLPHRTPRPPVRDVRPVGPPRSYPFQNDVPPPPRPRVTR